MELLPCVIPAPRPLDRFRRVRSQLLLNTLHNRREGRLDLRHRAEEYSPSVAGPWGRISVEAEVDGREWKTSVWRERSGRVLLPVPKHIRGLKGHGDSVSVRLRFSTF